MAKKSIKNYVFYPGLGLDDNLYPNAYSLIEQNFDFIKKEVAAWIGAQVAAGNPDFLFNRAKCIRDLGYVVDGVRYDMALGTNYNAVFQGRAESNSQEISPTVIETIRNAEARILTLASVSQDDTAVARLEAAFDEVVDIATNGPVSADIITFTNPTSANAANIAANEKLIENLEFIKAEVNAWVDVTYPDHNHDVAKCSRDVQYAIEAAAYDILYGGNSASYDSARFFDYYSATAATGITDEHRDQTVAAYNHLQTFISDIVQGVAVTPSAGNSETQVTAGNTASATEGTEIIALLELVEDVVELGVADALDSVTRTAPAVTWATASIQNAFSEIGGQADTIISAVTPPAAYNYDSAKCERDTQFNLTAYQHDLRYGGNEETTRIANTYWEYDVAQVDGYRTPEVRAKEFTRDLITNNVLTNTPQSTPNQTQVAQVIDTSKTAEGNAPGRIQVLANLVRDVIESGTSALPAFERKGLGHVKFVGNYDLSDVLLMTNTTKNEIIYNFGDPKRGATLVQTTDDTPRDSSGYLVKYDFTDANRDADLDFPKFLQTKDALVTLNLVYNTSSHSSDDDLQIFVEKTENGESVTVTRPYAFGTDAIERMRVAPPLSMLDADFEYGLQPTKWSAIGMQRGYPSIYEVPGSETEVRSVVTDASIGTEGVGASLITVTTQGAHGFTPGTPITIKALEQSVLGASRAEGSFVVITTPENNVFTYYAKAKVGANDGDVLATTYTQLRRGAFYTGANVGDPEFTVASNGTAGVMTMQLGVQTGENRLAFTGDIPEIGAPIVYDDIPIGSQVTAISSTPDGEALIPITTADINPGQTQFDVSDATGIVVGLAADNGDGDAIFVTDITGSTVTMSGEFTVTLTQAQETYTGVSGTVNTAAGINAEFNLSKTGTTYTVEAIAQGGSGYQVGDQILITGDLIGGTTPANDATITVTTIDGVGSVTAASVEGTALDGAITYTSVVSTYNNSGGTNLPTIDVTYAGGQYDTVTLGSPNASSGWTVGDRIRIPGTSVAPGIGQTGNAAAGGNDLIIKVTEIDGPTDDEAAAGTVTGVEIDATDWSLGAPPSVDRTYQSSEITFTGGSGTGFEFEITASGTSYSTRIIAEGTGYTTADTITLDIMKSCWTPSHKITVSNDAAIRKYQYDLI